ncbi:MAG TPA: twin-arginine translocase subunit TatC [Sporosarcina sp.]|nr:twin-arginine translocase subunit TatC [Sporosarcina sp.]
MAEQQEQHTQSAANQSSQQEEVKVQTDPNVFDHLSELRSQLIKSAVVFIVFFILVFSTINIWFPYVTKGHQLIILSPLEVVSFYMTISLSIAFGLAIPFVCYFLWKFVKPGLTEKESRFISLYSPVMLLLFLIGIAFGYFVVNPLSYNFLTSLGAINFDVMISAHEYVRFLLFTTLPIGLMFELPMVAMFLASIGLLTVDTLKKVRKWSYVSLAIISALITPPDFISQLIVLIPMIGLYEVSIRLVARIEKRDQLKRLKESTTSS